MDDHERYLSDPEHGVIIGYLRGERPDWEGRWLSNILLWGNSQLESDHQYIQWMFPLITASQSVFAPRLKEFEIEAFQNDSEIRLAMLRSYDRMLTFYGFALQLADDRFRVSPSQSIDERSAVWMTPENHNYKRISRMIASLTLAGLSRQAVALLDALETLYATTGAERIDQIAIWHWRQYAQSDQGVTTTNQRKDT